MSERTAVVSSVYWSSFVSFLSMVMPFIVEFCLIAITRQGFNDHHKEIWRKWISLPNASFNFEVLRGDTIVNNAALYIC